MEITLKIDDSLREIQYKILMEFASALNDAINRSLIPIKKRMGDLCKELVRATPEFQSIWSNDKLNYELGLSNPQHTLNAVLDALAEGVEVVFNPVVHIAGNKLAGSVQVILVKDKFTDILGISEAQYRSGRYNIPWLHWLLFEGDRVLLADYGILRGTFAHSRSGEAIMVKNNKRWSMPPEFSGTEDNNFITRAFTGRGDTEQLIGKILEEEITSRIK